MEKLCYVTQISLTGKNSYLSCPLCKRKVTEEENGTCSSEKCGKPYQKDFKLKMPEFLDRQLKVTVTAKKETYNGVERVKYGVNKAILDIDYAHEAAVIGKQLEMLIGSMK